MLEHQITARRKNAHGDVTIEVHGQRQDTPPLISHIDYTVIVDTDENDRKLALLHSNIQKFWHNL